MKTHPRIVVRLALALAAPALNLSVTQQAKAVAFTTTGPLSSIRAGHSTTLLRNGTVLVVGGFNGTVRLASSERYDPATGRWTASGAMAIGRTTHTATLLSNGKVLATGGHVSATVPLVNWTVLGVVPEFSPGLFAVSDPQAANSTRRFYRVRSP